MRNDQAHKEPENVPAEEMKMQRSSRGSAAKGAKESVVSSSEQRGSEVR